MKKTFFVLMLLGIMTVCRAEAMGANPDEKAFQEGKKVRISGVLRLVGNEPFTRLCVRVTLKTNHMDIFLPGEDKKKYQDLVSRDVETEGVFHTETFTSANRKYKFREYSLSNVTVLKVIPASVETNK